MPNPIAPVVAERRAKMRDLSDDALRDAAVMASNFMEEQLIDFCCAFAEMERRKLNVEDLRPYVPEYYARIASGNVSAKAWLRFAEYPLLMRKMAQLPWEQQEEFGDGAPVKVVTVRDGNYSPLNHLLMNPLDLERHQVNRVFGEGKIRSETEQLAWIESERERQPAESKCRVVLDFDLEFGEKLSRKASEIGVTMQEYILRVLKKAK